MKYRMLELGEKIQNGDQYMPTATVGPYWCPIEPASVGVDLWKINVGFYRRPIKKSKPKYRLLKNNEIVREGDQAYDTITRGWYYVSDADELIGEKVFWWVGNIFASRFRRKVKN
jgi:hypothetical protein